MFDFIAGTLTVLFTALVASLIAIPLWWLYFGFYSGLTGNAPFHPGFDDFGIVWLGVILLSNGSARDSITQNATVNQIATTRRHLNEQAEDIRRHLSNIGKQLESIKTELAEYEHYEEIEYEEIDG